MISIVIPLYNKETQIEATLNSIFKQTFQDFEIIIVNDGSTDNSVKIVERFTDRRIRLIHQENKGVSMARNKGINESKYDLIAFLDADDKWDVDYLYCQYKLYLKYNSSHVFAFNYIKYNIDTHSILETHFEKIPFNGEDGILSNYLEVASCSNPPLFTSAIMVKKEALVDIGGFKKDLKIGEDLLMWALLSLKYEIAFSFLPKVTYIIENDNKPSRIPFDLTFFRDTVGNILIKEYSKNKNNAHLKEYIAFWFKMRASINLSFGNKIAALKLSCHSLIYNPFNYKPIFIIIISILPSQLASKIINRFRKV